MKKFFFLFSFIFFLFSCHKEDSNKSVASAKLDSEFINFTGNVLSYENDEKTISVSNSKLIETFKEFVAENNLKIEPLYHKIESIDGKNYLRIYSKDNYVSTVDLIKTNLTNRQITIGKTVCTSKICATGGGCIPNGDYCTEFIPPNTQPGSGITGDCSRSTSN